MTDLDVLDDNGAGHRVLAVTARAVKLAKVHDGEAINGNGTLAVVLDDLVVGTLGTSTFDESVAVTLDAECVLADVNPPYVLDGAGSLAVDTFDLICIQLSGPPESHGYCRVRTLSNDGVLQRSTILKDEDGVGIASLGLSAARDTTAVRLEATIKGTGDALGLLVGH